MNYNTSRHYVKIKFIVQEGKGIHQNIEMKEGGGQFLGGSRAIQILVLVVLVFGLLLAYNFYKDRARIH